MKQATFTVNYISMGQASVPPDSESTNEYLSNYFKNYPTTPVRTASSSSSSSEKTGTRFGGRYLMITIPKLETTLAPFAAYKRNLGYEVTVVTTNTTGTTKENIKAYIKGRYDNRETRPDFVLLVGNNGHLPASGGYFNGTDEDNPLTDLHYACLDGDDYEPDVFLGRWPVSEISQLQNIINKTTFMEMNIPRFEKKAVFISGKDRDCSWYNLVCRFRKQFTEGKWEVGNGNAIRYGLIPAGYQNGNIKNLIQPNLDNVVNALNDNPLIFTYSGHGGPETFIGKTFSFGTSSISTATNTVFPFVFAFSCHTGNFGTSSIGQYWLNDPRGGVSYFGASVKVYINALSNLEEKIFGDAIKKDEEQLGPIIDLGKKRYKVRFWSKINQQRTKNHLRAFNLLGDPSLNIWGRAGMLNAEYVCPVGMATIHNPENIPVEWTVTGNFALSNRTNTSVKIIKTSNGADQGTITARFAGCGSVTTDIQSCSVSISGPGEVCYDGSIFTFNNAPPDLIWSVDYPYDTYWDVANYPRQIRIYKIGSPNVPRTITVSVDGVVITGKTVNSCQMSIEGNGNLCENGNYYYARNVPNEVPDNQIIWTCSSNIRLIGGNTGRTKMFAPNSQGVGWIKAYIDPYYRYLEKDIFINYFPDTELYYPINANCNDGHLRVSPMPQIEGITNYRWTTLGGDAYVPASLFYTYGTENYYKFPYSGTGTIFAYGINTCGEQSSWPTYRWVYYVYGSCSSYSSVSSYPNPASNILNVEFDQAAIAQAETFEQKVTDAKQLKQEKTFDIRLYDNQGNMLRRSTTKGGSVQFNIASLPNGIYYLHIYDGINEKPEMRQIVVEH